MGDPLLGYVTLPEGLEYVGEDAFSITDTLKYVEFPSTLKTIDKKGFSSYRGFRLDLPDSLEYIGEEAFSYFSVETDLIIPEGSKRTRPRCIFNGFEITKSISSGKFREDRG